MPVVIVREKSGQGGVSIERKYLQDIFRRAGILKGEALHFYDGYIVAHNDIAIFQQVFNFGVPDCTLPNPSDIASWLKELPKETKSLKVSFDESSFVFSDGKNHFEAETNPLNINVGIRSYLDNLFCGRPGYTKFTVAPDTCKDAIITGKSMEEDNCVILHRRMNAISGKFNKYFDFAGFDISLFEKTVNAIGKNHNIVFELSEIHGNAPFAVIYSDGSDFRFYLVGYAREYVIDHVPPVAWLEFDATPDGFFDEFQAALEAMPIPAIAEPITETATATTTPGTVAPVEPAKPETSASATPAEQTAPKPETATVHANRFIYAEITDRIVRELEKGIVPWKKPWKSGCGRPKNLLTGKEYNGVNFWLLQIMPYISPYWLTWKQAEKMGGTVKPRQKPCPIVFWKRYLKEDRETGDAELRQFLKISAVYNLEQIDDIEAPETVVIPEVNGIESAEKIIAAMPNKPKISDNGAKAVYYPLEDLVVTPNIKYFKTAEGYYGTLFHELGHSTGHKTRLARKELMTAAAFGSEVYSKEELTAELCAAFLCAECRIEETTIENSSAYIGGWLKKLKDDKTLFFMAAQRAQKAADYILDRKADYGE
ncbi:MAG: ssDNA-binding domain-containing protein [Desulfovibrio sp.]|nr:ssDNA-binding domain-containing protein [Desulfovibrio sp.]